VKKRKLWASLLLGAGITLVLCVRAGYAAPSDCALCESFGIQRSTDKKAAPPFSLKDLAGAQISLGDQRGKPVIVVFWLSYCVACKEDLALLEKLMEGRQNQISVLTVAVDGEKERAIRRAVKDNKISQPVLLDLKEKVARSYGVKMVPTAFLINREGQLAGTIVGQRDWAKPEGWPAIREVLGLQ
jgi:peroxiredoxin